MTNSDGKGRRPTAGFLALGQQENGHTQCQFHGCTSMRQEVEPEGFWGSAPSHVDRLAIRRTDARLASVISWKATLLG